MLIRNSAIRFRLFGTFYLWYQTVSHLVKEFMNYAGLKYGALNIKSIFDLCKKIAMEVDFKHNTKPNWQNNL